MIWTLGSTVRRSLLFRRGAGTFQREGKGTGNVPRNRSSSGQRAEATIAEDAGRGDGNAIFVGYGDSGREGGLGRGRADEDEREEENTHAVRDILLSNLGSRCVGFETGDHALRSAPYRSFPGFC